LGGAAAPPFLSHRPQNVQQYIELFRTRDHSTNAASARTQRVSRPSRHISKAGNARRDTAVRGAQESEKQAAIQKGESEGCGHRGDENQQLTQTAITASRFTTEQIVLRLWSGPQQEWQSTVYPQSHTQLRRVRHAARASSSLVQSFFRNHYVVPARSPFHRTTH
jgi:hypothetical protein